MTTRAPKRTLLEDIGVDQTSLKSGEKTIPFLRRLIDMLRENSSVISFHPGVRSQSIAGRIIVHDRAQVESEILPRYFNHASFASLRRQLNYFAFSREGKGKQKGATYINDQVFDLDDILHLKRRLPGSAVPVAQKPPVRPQEPVLQPSSTQTQTQASATKKTDLVKSTPRRSSSKRSKTKKVNRKVQRIINSVVPVVHIPNKRQKTRHQTNQQSNATSMNYESHQSSAPQSLLMTAISPPPPAMVSNNNSTQTLLDLTKPPPSEESSHSSIESNSCPPEHHQQQHQQQQQQQQRGWLYRPFAINRDVSFELPPSQTKKEEDVIALLSLGFKTSH